MVTMLDLNSDENDHQKAKALVEARHELDRRAGEFVRNASSSAEVDQRIAMSHEQIAEVAERYLPGIKDADVLLARALRDSWEGHKQDRDTRNERQARRQRREAAQQVSFEEEVTASKTDPAIARVLTAGADTETTEKRLADAFNERVEGIKDVTVYDDRSVYVAAVDEDLARRVAKVFTGAGHQVQLVEDPDGLGVGVWARGA